MNIKYFIERRHKSYAIEQTLTDGTNLKHQRELYYWYPNLCQMLTQGFILYKGTTGILRFTIVDQKACLWQHFLYRIPFLQVDERLAGHFLTI